MAPGCCKRCGATVLLQHNCVAFNAAPDVLQWKRCCYVSISGLSPGFQKAEACRYFDPGYGNRPAQVFLMHQNSFITSLKSRSRLNVTKALGIIS
jgi:hypothetical protein